MNETSFAQHAARPSRVTLIARLFDEGTIARTGRASNATFDVAIGLPRVFKPIARLG